MLVLQIAFIAVTVAAMGMLVLKPLLYHSEQYPGDPISRKMFLFSFAVTFGLFFSVGLVFFGTLFGVW